MLTEYSLQKKITSNAERKSFNAFLTKTTTGDLIEFDDDTYTYIANLPIMDYIQNTIDGLNGIISDHILKIARTDITKHLQGKLFKCNQLNDSMPYIKLYKHVELDRVSGYFCTIKVRSYTLTELFPDDEICLDAVTKLSYHLNDTQYTEAITKANEVCVAVNNNSNTSVVAKYYKNAIGNKCNKYYKGILDDLAKYIVGLLDIDVKPKMFNAICLEWLASKACRSCKQVTFKGEKRSMPTPYYSSM